jgi:hypothetical protein
MRAEEGGAKSTSSGSLIGVEITYPPLAHLPRSIKRQRSLQKGNPGSERKTILRQVGQRKLRTLLAMARDLLKYLDAAVGIDDAES